MGETSGGQLRFVRQETPITPQRLPRFCIEVDDALRVGGSGFLGESDAGEAGYKQNQGASEANCSSSQRR